MDDRLTRADWIRQGLRTLASEGPDGLKVGAMAEALTVSRGSFYWHFRDIADFRQQILRNWQETTTDEVMRQVEGEAAEPDRLRTLMRRSFGMKGGLDRAMRAWAGQNREVAALVANVDASRAAYIARLLVESGVEGEQAARRAAFIYWALLGRMFVMDPRQSTLAAGGMDDIGDLFEA